MTNKTIACWCGNDHLNFFSSTYLHCDQCQTLVSLVGLNAEDITITNDDRDFYGKKYWDNHQKDDLGLPDVYTRARADLTDRCLHWLQTVLKYKLPPAKILELGCAHGGFVAMLNQAGFKATGLELSPGIVEFARNTFDIPMFCGPIEEQDIKASSLDVIALMDVIEHLFDPVMTMQHCLSLLKKDGIMVIQCPRYQEGMSYEEMVDNNNPFLEQLKADEHLYLFSQSSIQQFFKQLGAKKLQFEQAIFGHYDMFFIVGLSSLSVFSRNDAEKALIGSRNGRFVLALQDIAGQREELNAHLVKVEKDRSARLKMVEDLGKQLSEVEEDRAERLHQLEDLSSHLEEVEKDRSARLDMVEALGKQLSEVEEDRAERLHQLEDLSSHLEEVEKDRSARLDMVEALGKQLSEVEEDRAERLHQVEALSSHLAEVEKDRQGKARQIEKLNNEFHELDNRLNRYKEIMNNSWCGRYLLKKLNPKREK